MMTCGVLPGPYRVPGAYRAVCHFRLTNKTPAATYRAPGRFETTFVRERLVDAIAHQLKLDPIHVRRLNAVRVDEMPFKRPLEALGEEIHFDSGDYHALLDITLDHVNWTELNRELAARRENGEMVGVGLAMFVEKAGLGPADGVRIQVDTTGEIEVITGGASIGQGFETVMAQVAAEMLGADMTKMRVIHGQTDRIEHGIGAHASRATVMTASATRVAALKVRDKALDIASELMQAPLDTLDIINGEVVVKGRAGGPSMTLGQIAAALGPSSKTRGDREPGLSAEGWFYADHQVYPYGNHLAVVKVDPDTGGVKVLRYVVGYDIGRAINPVLVKGQIAGGFAQGLGGALMEEFTYNERGDPLAVTFADYLLPTVRETPDLEIILREDYPTPLNPLGIKGAGESGVNAVGAAIASAIDDAIGIPGAITQLPVTPQRLKAILDSKK
jgi:carbon-monoxide dehydrogenase large subunit/6-hydroxypseudooxynicotine dehydrogenase subunit gamma